MKTLVLRLRVKQ